MYPHINNSHPRSQGSHTTKAEIPDFAEGCSLTQATAAQKNSLPESTLPPYYNDFERWCEECVMISDKITGQPVPFRLNAAQRRLARIMERQRREGKPVRIILLKARQWGGSTLVQVYMAWQQLVRAIGHNALVCAHVKDAAALIRSTYSMLLAMYPDDMKAPDPADWKLKPFQQTQGTLWIPARQARLAITSANSPDSLRGAAYHLAHLSEAAFWGDGDEQAASAIVRTVCGTVPSLPDTMIVVESTANGPDNWFAKEWNRAVAGKSDKTPVFVPWHEIEIYRSPLSAEQRRALPRQMDDYELRLMADGVSLEAIAWYHNKRREYSSHAEMMAEFPSSPEEAFATSAVSPFPASLTANLPWQTDNGKEPPVPCLRVAVAAEVMKLLEFGIVDGRLLTLHEEEAPSPSSLMETVLNRHRRQPCSMAVVECTPPDGQRHGRWYVRYARRNAIPLHYCGETPLLSTGCADLLGELIDNTRHLLEEDKLRDCNPRAPELYRLFDPARPWRFPAMTGRLAAAYLLEERLGEAALSPSDFI